MKDNNINLSTESSNKVNDIENNNLENVNIDSIKLNINLKNEKKRKYGIDLLRIKAMFMIITVHIISFSDFKKRNELLFKKKYYLYFIWLWGLKCNTIFVLIERYVGLNLRNKLSSILYLIITTNIYSIIIEFISIKNKKIQYKIYQYIFIFFPICRNLYWFYTCYIGLCYIKPYINLIIKNIF